MTTENMRQEMVTEGKMKKMHNETILGSDFRMLYMRKIISDATRK